MRLDQLTSAQVKFFAENASVTNSFMGGRRFVADLYIDGKTERIVAIAKDVYAQIEKERNTYGESKYQKIFNKFRNIEIKTRDKNEFSKRLNFIQKIYYYIVKFFYGIDYKDTWVNKFPISDRFPSDNMTLKEIQHNNLGSSYVPHAASGTILASQKIKRALSAFNGMSYDHVIVNTVGRGTWLYGVGLLAIESPCHGDKKYFDKHIFYNPRALIITVIPDEGGDWYRDDTIPKDVTCGTYYMKEAEYHALPKVSRKLTDFMKKL